MKAAAGPTVYLTVYAVLMALLGLTVAVSFLELGAWSPVIALTIGVVKTVLVILYFMHVRYSTPVTWLFVLAGFFWLLILMILAMSDYLTRHWSAG